MNQQFQQIAVAQCRETTADAALKWSFVSMMLLIGVGMLLSSLVPTYWEWKWRRKAKKEGLTK